MNVLNTKVKVISFKKLREITFKHHNHYYLKDSHSRRDVAFTHKNIRLCGTWVTLRPFNAESRIYFVEEDGARWGWADWMFEGTLADVTGKELKSLLED